MRRNSSTARDLRSSLDTSLAYKKNLTPRSYVNWDNFQSNYSGESESTSYVELSPTERPNLRLIGNPEEEYERRLDEKVKAENDYWASDQVLELDRIFDGRGKDYYKLNDRLNSLVNYVNSDSFTKDAEMLRKKSFSEYFTITQRLNEELKKISNNPKYLEKINNGKLDENLYNSAIENTKLALKKLKSKSNQYHNIDTERVRWMKQNPQDFFPEDLHKNGLISDNEFTRYKVKKAEEQRTKVKRKRNKWIAAAAGAGIIIGSLFAGVAVKFMDYKSSKFNPASINYEKVSLVNYNR